MKIKTKRYVEQIVEVDVELPFYYKDGKNEIGVFTPDGGRIKIVYDWAGTYLKVDNEACLQSHQYLVSDNYQITKEEWQEAVKKFKKQIDRLETKGEDIYD